MNITEQAIDFAGEHLLLTNQRAVYWQRKMALILSDLHLGKAAHFRKNGIALPGAAGIQDLNRLEFLINHYQPEQVIIVGDLIHADINKEVTSFVVFTQKFPGVRFTLIKGNHDRFSAAALKNIGISFIHQELFLDPILFSHQNTGAASFTISGHIHPGVSIQFPAKQQMRFPCYAVSSRHIILPAFSQFTGLDTASVPEDAVCYALYEGGIFKVKN